MRPLLPVLGAVFIYVLAHAILLERTKRYFDKVATSQLSNREKLDIEFDIVYDELELNPVHWPQIWKRWDRNKLMVRP